MGHCWYGLQNRLEEIDRETGELVCMTIREDRLQHHALSEIFATFTVDDLNLYALSETFCEVIECDVCTMLSIVQSTIGIAFNKNGRSAGHLLISLTLTGYSARETFAYIAEDLKEVRRKHRVIFTLHKSLR